MYMLFQKFGLIRILKNIKNVITIQKMIHVRILCGVTPSEIIEAILISNISVTISIINKKLGNKLYFDFIF